MILRYMVLVVCVVHFGVAEAKIQIILQELKFGIPEDRFIKIVFDNNHNKIEDVVYFEKPNEIILNDRVYKGFIENIHKTDYAWMLTKQTNNIFRYNYYLIDIKSNKIIHNLGVNKGGGVFEGKFYYAAGLSLYSIVIDGMAETKVDDNVTGVAVNEKNKIVFYLNGEINQNSPLNFHKIESIDGLVRGAGFIDEHWMWYYSSKNEKSKGRVWFLNINTGVKIPVKACEDECRVVSSEIIRN